MTLVAGIDPGSSGAVAVYDTATQTILSIEDLPFWFQTVGKKKRKRLDPIGMMEVFELLSMMGVGLVVLEAVGGRPRQSASSGFVFGYTVGMITMALMYNKLIIETIPPAQWKKVMRVPGKRGGKEGREKLAKIKSEEKRKVAVREMIKQADGDIMRRVAELFPHDQDKFRTARGAFRMDRADAALLAKFGGDYIMATMPAQSADVELSIVYRNADTGA